MVAEEGNLEAVEAKKNEYDLIILNASAWAIGTIDNDGRNIIKSIANSTHLITMGNDERYIPFMEDGRHLSNVTVDVSKTSNGDLLIGDNIESQGDSSLYTTKFNDNTTVLYTATYKNDSTGEVVATGDAIGFGNYRANNNWIHIQLGKISNSILHDLSIMAINGLQVPGNVVENMPEDEIRGYTEVFNLSSQIPSRVNCTFLGWSETPTGNAIYTAGQEFTMPNQDVTLYAVWGSRIEYSANIKALIVGYSENNRTWMNSAVEYLNNTGDFVAEGMFINGGELHKVVERKNDFDIIVINASAWAPSTIESNGANKLIEIANATHLITFGNDETNIPLIRTYQHIEYTDVRITPTTEGRNLIGEELPRQTDSALQVVTFKSNVTPLYIASYVDRTGGEEYLTSGDVIGFKDYTSKTNWIHGQINSINNSILYKLIRTTLNGLERTETIVRGMPNDTIREQAISTNIAGTVPTMKGYTFKGWAESPNGVVKYAAGQSFVIPKGNLKLYAVWEKR